MITLGWKEWVALPDIGVARIKAKIDTGARTSALHAFAIRDYEENGDNFVEFKLHPRQRDSEKEITCVAPIVDQRIVRDSGGHAETRFVIETLVKVGKTSWPIEITLTSRDDMLFRMLLGRTAMNGRAMVDPSQKYLTKRRKL